MNEFIKAVRVLIIALCVALFAVGIIWNLVYGTMSEQEAMATLGQPAVSDADWEQQYTAEQMQAATEARLFSDFTEAQTAPETLAADLENRLATVRMERDSSWTQLQDGLAVLEFDEKQQCLKAYEVLQYQEQRLELLLKAKGIAHCLVVLSETQANIIVDGDVLSSQYEKIYDLVQRNTDYLPEQIILVPLEEKTENSGSGA